MVMAIPLGDACLLAHISEKAEFAVTSSLYGNGLAQLLLLLFSLQS
jgi:hypothetical protein